MVSKLKFRETHWRIFWILLFSALFFSIIAIVQYIFIESQARKTALSQLNNLTQEVIGGISYTDHWDLKKYRQAEILASNFYIISENGVVIDIEGFIPGLIPSPKFLMKLKPMNPETITTSLGETWQVLLKNIRDGSVVLGISNPDDIKEANKNLLKNAGKFNNLSVEQVTKPSFPREIAAEIEYAVFDNNGNLKIQLGGIPLELDKINLSKLVATEIQDRKIGGKEYLTLATPITDLSKKVVGRILVPLDVSLQQKALKIQERFNFIVVVLSWLIVILLLSWFVISNERAKRKSQISLEEGLKSGESQIIEFKETLDFDVKSNAQNQGVLKSTLKTLAAFLNSKGGTLFIGVSDNNEIKGLERDFRFCKGKNVDGFQQKLRDLLCSRFHPTPWGKVNFRFESMNNMIVCAIDAPALPKPEVVHLDGEVYIREGNTTRKLDGPQLTNWLQERFHS